MDEIRIKSRFAELKWRDKYCCILCGCEEYTKGKKFPDRRCSNCKTGESLYVNTALEGLRFPIEDLYKALYIIYKSSRIEDTDDIILFHGAYISIDTFINNYSHLFQGYNKFNQDAIINDAILSRRKTIKEISDKVGVQENTLSLRLKKIADRLPNINEGSNYYEKIRSFFNQREISNDGVYKILFDFNDFLKIILFPTKGVWTNGILYHRGHRFEFEDEPGLQFIMTSANETELSDTLDELDKISYASDSWKYIFVENRKVK